MTFAIFWYIAWTLFGIWFASTYNGWISKKVESSPLPSSILTAFGVAGVEILRVIRAAPIVCYFVSTLDGTGDPLIVGLLYVAAYTIDALSAYVSTGLVMINGNLEREARAKLAAQLEDIGDGKA